VQIRMPVNRFVFCLPREKSIMLLSTMTTIRSSCYKAPRVGVIFQHSCCPDGRTLTWSYWMYVMLPEIAATSEL
jgi:hypothetical protein